MNGAKVIIGGVNYQAALDAATKAVESEPGSVLVPAYDHPTLWEGHSSMIDEMKDQLPDGVKPDAVFTSVGGGGLLAGVMRGCQHAGWEEGALLTSGVVPLMYSEGSPSVPIIALETQGANCFYESMSANNTSAPNDLNAATHVAAKTIAFNDAHNVHVAHLASITSRAKCLGATSPSPAVVRMALDRKGPIQSVCVSDQMSMTAAVKFAGEYYVYH